MSRVPENFIINLQGKKFVLYSGLLELAHQDGLSASNTEILQYPNDQNKQTCVVKAVVTTKKGTFSGIGDASPASVPNKNIAVHAIRMAETRAMARALRVATNVDMTAFEELGADIADEAPVVPQKPPKTAAPVEPVNSQSYREQQAKELRELKKQITAKAKEINLIGPDFIEWLDQTHNITWEQLTIGKADLVLSDLAAIA